MICFSSVTEKTSLTVLRSVVTMPNHWATAWAGIWIHTLSGLESSALLTTLGVLFCGLLVKHNNPWWKRLRTFSRYFFTVERTSKISGLSGSVYIVQKAISQLHVHYRRSDRQTEISDLNSGARLVRNARWKPEIRLRLRIYSRCYFASEPDPYKILRSIRYLQRLCAGIT